MSTQAGLLTENIVILAVGYSLLYALGFARIAFADLRLIGLAYLTGWSFLGVVISLVLMVGLPSGIPTTGVIAAATVCACALAGRHAKNARPMAIPHRRRPLAIVLAGFAALVLVVDLVAAYVVSGRNRWDPFLDLLTAWLPRAQIIHATHTLDASLWQSFITPWYPPLIPAMYGTTFDFAGGYHPSILARQQTLLGIAFLLAVIGVLDWYVPRWITLPAVALLASTPWFWWRLESLLPDQTVAYLIAAAAIVSVLWLHERRSEWLVLGLVFLAAASLTKIEGAIFGGLLAFVVLVTAFATERRTARSAAVLLLGPALLLPWRLWLSTHQVSSSTPDYNASHFLSPTFLLHRSDRLLSAMHYMLRAPFHGHLGQEPRTIAICTVAAAVVVAAALRLRSTAIAIIVWLILSFLALAGIYWTSRVEIGFYLSTSASRVGTTLIVATAALAPLLLGLALRPVLSDDRPESFPPEER